MKPGTGEPPENDNKDVIIQFLIFVILFLILPMVLS